MIKESIKTEEFSIWTTIVIQLMVAAICIVIGVPVGLGIAWLAEILVTDYLGLDLNGFLADAPLGRTVALFCLLSLPLITVVVTGKQLQEMPSLKEIGLQVLKSTMLIGGIILCLPLFMAAYKSEWEAFVFTLVVGLIVLGCFGGIIGIVQVGQHWIDPDNYKKMKRLLSNKGALAATRAGLLPFHFRLQKTWELIVRTFLFLGCVVILPLHIAGKVVAGDDYSQQGLIYLTSIAGILLFPLGMGEVWYQLKRSYIYHFEGTVKKLNKRGEGKTPCRIEVSGHEYKVSERMWKQLRDGERYRLYFATWYFFFKQGELLAFETCEAVSS